MIRKLATHAALTDGDYEALRGLPHVVRSIETGSYLVQEGETSPDHVVLLSGYAYRHKTTSMGGRQIVSLQIPGEAVACSSLFFDAVDHSTQALTPIEAVFIPRAVFRELVEKSATIGHAILLMTLIEASISTEWLLNLGRRDAKARVAHLLCEFAARLDAAGLSDGKRYDLPLTQEQLGDALGLTPVHINRTLKKLRADGLLVLSNKTFSLPLRAEVHRVADFTGEYLRIDQPRGVADG